MTALLANVAASAALRGVADLLDLYADLADARSPEQFDQLDAELAVARAELIPLLDVARESGVHVGGPIRDQAVELRRHVDQDWPA